MNRIETQVQVVVDSVEQILAQIDNDVLSPTYGCAHLAFWRDKTSEFADMRRQEAMYALALLYKYDFPGSAYKSSLRLLNMIRALLSFWVSNRYSDGSMDEWYKGERAYAVVAFSVHAVSRTLFEVGELLPAQERRLAESALSQSARWLCGRDDLFKTNHQAVGVAALAWSGYVLRDDTFVDNAKKKLCSIIRAQTGDGWFPEVGHFDVGYTFLTVEFVAMAMNLWNDWSGVEYFRKAYDFACEWLHPDMSVGLEYGVCHNAYVSSIASILLGEYSERAFAVTAKLLLVPRLGSVNTGVGLTLADELRLMRWAFQPLLAHRLVSVVDLSHLADPEKCKLPLEHTKGGIVCYKGVALARFSNDIITGIFAGCAGGLVRFFSANSNDIFSDHGYVLIGPKGKCTNTTYNRNVFIEAQNNSLCIRTPIVSVKKFMPSFMARLVLRVVSSTALGSRMIRKIIDIVRERKGTAVNQSSANLSSSDQSIMLRRKIELFDGRVVVSDLIQSVDQFDVNDLYLLEEDCDRQVVMVALVECVAGLVGKYKSLKVVKEYSFRAEGEWISRCIAAVACPETMGNGL